MVFRWKTIFNQNFNMLIFKGSLGKINFQYIKRTGQELVPLVDKLRSGQDQKNAIAFDRSISYVESLFLKASIFIINIIKQPLHQIRHTLTTTNDFGVYMSDFYEDRSWSWNIRVMNQVCVLSKLYHSTVGLLKKIIFKFFSYVYD